MFPCFSGHDTPSHPLTSEPNIVEDLKTDRDEVYEEFDKDELVNTLQDEYFKSAKGKWQILQKLVTSGQLFIKNLNYRKPKYSSHVEVTNQNTSRSHVTPSTPPSTKKTVIEVHHGKQNGFHSHPPPVSSINPKQTTKVKFDTRYI